MFKQVFKYVRTEEGALAALLGSTLGLITSAMITGEVYFIQVFIMGVIIVNMLISESTTQSDKK